ncbi:hypothetical protein FQR65_LT20214 [Abscondita terminalis]|nr:hypothetical protein FQR65_LT20214 [Abscondita terminalis]
MSRPAEWTFKGNVNPGHGDSRLGMLCGLYWRSSVTVRKRLYDLTRIEKVEQGDGALQPRDVGGWRALSRLSRVLSIQLLPGLDDYPCVGMKMMAMIGFIRSPPPVFAEVMKATGQINPWCAHRRFDCQARPLGACLMLLVGLLVTWASARLFPRCRDPRGDLCAVVRATGLLNLAQCKSPAFNGGACRCYEEASLPAARDRDRDNAGSSRKVGRSTARGTGRAQPSSFVRPLKRRQCVLLKRLRCVYLMRPLAPRSDELARPQGSASESAGSPTPMPCNALLVGGLACKQQGPAPGDQAFELMQHLCAVLEVVHAAATGPQQFIDVLRTAQKQQLVVPVFKQMLHALGEVLRKAEATPRQRASTRRGFCKPLYPDMFPWCVRCRFAVDFAKGVSGRLAQVELPKYDDNESTFADLQALIARALGFIDSITPAQIDGKDGH